MERSRFYRDLSIDLRSERDKSVYFSSWGSYLLYNVIGTRKIAKQLPCFFPSKRGNLQSAILFMLSTAAGIITQTKSYEISAMSINSVVKLNFSRLSVCLHNAPPQRRQMTSHNVAFIDVISALKRSLCGHLTCALFYQTNLYHIYNTPLRCRYVVHCIIFTLANNFLRWTYFGPTRFIRPLTTLVHATLRVIDVIDKCNSWLADVTFDWRHVIVTAVERNIFAAYLRFHK